jgi:hypothetical protein
MWNVLRTFLYASEQVAANPMILVGRPKLTSPSPRTCIAAPLETAAQDRPSRHQKDWTERNLAIILAVLLVVLGWSAAWPLTWCEDADIVADMSASQRRREPNHFGPSMFQGYEQSTRAPMPNSTGIGGHSRPRACGS